MLPPTLIASIYGMNFQEWFPEIHWKYGYPFSLGLMLRITSYNVCYTKLLRRVLDDAARRVVRMAEPFANFPPDIARDFDILEITSYNFV